MAEPSTSPKPSGRHAGGKHSGGHANQVRNLNANFNARTANITTKVNRLSRRVTNLERRFIQLDQGNDSSTNDQIEALTNSIKTVNSKVENSHAINTRAINSLSSRLNKLETPSPAPDFNKYFCLLREKQSQKRFLGIGDDRDGATNKAAELCRNELPGANCTIDPTTIKCDNWQDYAGVDKVKCTIIVRQGTSKQFYHNSGRSLIEAEGKVTALCQRKYTPQYCKIEQCDY